MIVLDTHAWIWWRDDPARLTASAAAAIAAADEIGVSTMSCLEAANLERSRRLRFDRPIESWVAAGTGPAGVHAIAPTQSIAVSAGLLPDDFPGDPIDRVIYATARSSGSILITADRAIRAFDPRLTIW